MRFTDLTSSLAERIRTSVSKLSAPKESNYCAGLDIGTKEIKLVELARKKKSAPWVMTVSRIETPQEALTPEGDIQPGGRKALIRAIQELVGEKIIPSAVVSVRGSGISHRQMTDVPLMSEEQLAGSIHAEVPRYTNIPMDDLFFDYVNMGGVTDQTGKQELAVLLVTATQKCIYSYFTMFQELGIKLLAMETQPIALSRVYTGYHSPNVIGVDLGIENTNIIYLKDGKLRYVHSHDHHNHNQLRPTFSFKGKMIDELLVEKLNLEDVESAESIKKSSSVKIDNFGPKTDPTKDPGAITRQALSKLIEELKQRIIHYRNYMKEEPKSIILSGGNSMIRDLDKYLEKELSAYNVKVERWIPSRFTEQNGIEIDDETMGLTPAIAVAIGLALKRGSEYDAFL